MAATARVHGLVLATLNACQFDRIPGLQGGGWSVQARSCAFDRIMAPTDVGGYARMGAEWRQVDSGLDDEREKEKLAPTDVGGYARMGAEWRQADSGLDDERKKLKMAPTDVGGYARLGAEWRQVDSGLDDERKKLKMAPTDVGGYRRRAEGGRPVRRRNAALKYSGAPKPVRSAISAIVRLV
jgi:ribosomal protein L32E